MKIYETEIKAGLKDAIESHVKASALADVVTASSFECPVAKQLVENTEVPAGMAMFTAILASVGWNKNDDVFSSNETYKAYHTASLKPVSVEHLTSEFEDANTICGFIVESLPLDQNFNMCQDESSFQHILNSLFVWSSYWPTTTQAVAEKTARGEQRVSMECMIKDFGYALKSESGEVKLLERTDKTAVLSSYLRRYGGPGKVKINGQTFQIGRWLRDLVFSGVSFVENPANEKSVVFKDYVIASTELENFDEALLSVNICKDLIMADEKKSDVVTNEKVEASDKTEASTETAAELASMKEKVESLTKAMDDAKAALAKAESEVAAYKSQVEAKDKALAEMQEKVECMNKEKTMAARKAVAAELKLNLAEDKIVAMSDEAFAAVVEFAKANSVATKVTEEVKTDEVKVDDIKEDTKVEADVVAASIASEGAKASTLKDAVARVLTRKKASN